MFFAWKRNILSRGTFGGGGRQTGWKDRGCAKSLCKIRNVPRKLAGFSA